MTALSVAALPQGFAFLQPSQSASGLGNKRLEAFARTINLSRTASWAPVGEELTREAALAQAKIAASTAVSEQARYLTPEMSIKISRDLAELLDPEMWDDEDPVLTVASVRTMLRAIISVEAGPGDITISRAGNLVTTWKFGDDQVRVEAKPTGAIAWTILHPPGASPRHQHVEDSTIDGLKAAISAL